MSHEEIIQLEKQLQTANRKLFSLKERLLRIQGTDATMEFRLEEEIAEIETVQNALQKRLAEAYNFHHQEGATILRKKITALNIEKRLGILHLVNCNREGMKDRFWEAFDTKESFPFQFYFIHACPTQMPPSFSERMIYELIYEELEEEESAIYLSRKADSGRVRFATLPITERCFSCFGKFDLQSP